MSIDKNRLAIALALVVVAITVEVSVQISQRETAGYWAYAESAPGSSPTPATASGAQNAMPANG
ncbi:MAG: hypothetical protein WDO68_01650 [Gammaproteobacteria bacterium]